MLLGELLIQDNIVGEEDIELALQRQRRVGGTIGENLIALGRLRPDQLEQVFRRQPMAPATIEATGLSSSFLVNLMLKCVHLYSLETPAQIAQEMRLRVSIVNELIDLAKQRAFIENLPSAQSVGATDQRYALTSIGKARVVESLEMSYYAGPAPVTLDEFRRQIARQRITHERVTAERLVNALSELVVPTGLVTHLGPAVNSGQSLLLYGPSGNGKTAIARAMARAFENEVFIPYALEIDGQIIKVFDPSVHRPVSAEAGAAGGSSSEGRLRLDRIDQRWVACRRPVIATGSELTLDQLDLIYNAEERYYDAPVQLRATGGILIVDDFGHQTARPADLLNRWMMPIEHRIDYLTLKTGRKYEFPIDQLTIFATNIAPNRLMDPAMLRRFPFKAAIEGPDKSTYSEIFEKIAADNGMSLPDGLIDHLAESFYERHNRQLASFHPAFIVNYVIARCRFEGRIPILDTDLVTDALTNLFVKQ